MLSLWCIIYVALCPLGAVSIYNNVLLNIQIQKHEERFLFELNTEEQNPLCDKLLWRGNKLFTEKSRKEFFNQISSNNRQWDISVQCVEFIFYLS